MPRYDLVCTTCRKEFIDLFHSIHDPHPPCECGGPTETLWRQSPMVNGDEIPGGVDIRHGICNEDGTPKRYYSYSEIRKAAFEKGYFQGDDTPKVNNSLIDARSREKYDTERRRKEGRYN